MNKRKFGIIDEQHDKCHSFCNQSQGAKVVARVPATLLDELPVSSASS